MSGMTETTGDVMIDPATGEIIGLEESWQAREQGVSLVNPDGLLTNSPRTCSRPPWQRG